MLTKLYVVRIVRALQMDLQHNQALNFKDSQKLRDKLIREKKFLPREIVVYNHYEGVWPGLVNIVDLTK